MNIAELQSKIVLNQIPSLLVFTGKETGIMDIYLKKLIEISGAQAKFVDSVEDVYKQCSGKSIISKSKIFVVVDDLDFIKNEKAWKSIRTILGDNKLILKYHTQDSRIKFWKEFENDVVVFEPMSDKVLAKHLSNDYRISDENALLLAILCRCDYIRSKLELDKVVSFSKANKCSLDDAFETCYKTNVICGDVDTTVFEFVDSVLKRDYKKFLSEYRELMLKDEQPLKLIGALYNGFKNVLIAKTMTNAKNIYVNAGINYNSYMKAKAFIDNYSVIELENILYTLKEIEQGIKVGIVEKDFSVDILFVNL